MGNYAVRIYDPELKAWLIAEAERRGRGIRTSDIVEDALRKLMEGSNAGNVDGDATSAGRDGRDDRDHHAGGRRGRERRATAGDGRDEARREDSRSANAAAVGSDAPKPEAAEATDGAVPGGSASDHGAAAAESVSGEAVVQPVPALDLHRAMVADVTRLAVTIAEGAASMFSVGHDASAMRAVEEVDRAEHYVKGPDSGPDKDLGF